VRRDESGATFYEAALPLSEMPSLCPQNRGARDIPVRFSWIVHTDEGPVLEWSEATNVFGWWRNPGSFWPPTYLPLAAQTTLGFSVAPAPLNLAQPNTAPQNTANALPQVQTAPESNLPPAPAVAEVPATTDTAQNAAPDENSPLKPLPPLPPSSLPPAEAQR
jgi:hypothetical protein